MPKVKGGTFSRKNLTPEKNPKVSIPKRKNLTNEKILLKLEKDYGKLAKDPIKCHLGELQF